jgi:CheY-like chemotaxis protein
MTSQALPRVLVIDDNASAARAIVRSLAGRAVVTVGGSVAEALTLLTSGATFDLIISDVMMPDGTGPDFFERAVAMTPQLADRIVFATGGATSEEIARIVALGVRCLQKPLTFNVLSGLVQEATIRMSDSDD